MSATRLTFDLAWLKRKLLIDEHDSSLDADLEDWWELACEIIDGAINNPFEDEDGVELAIPTSIKHAAMELVRGDYHRHLAALELNFSRVSNRDIGTAGRLSKAQTIKSIKTKDGESVTYSSTTDSLVRSKGRTHLSQRQIFNRFLRKHHMPVGF